MAGQALCRPIHRGLLWEPLCIAGCITKEVRHLQVSSTTLTSCPLQFATIPCHQPAADILFVRAACWLHAYCRSCPHAKCSSYSRPSSECTLITASSHPATLSTPQDATFRLVCICYLAAEPSVHMCSSMTTLAMHWTVLMLAFMCCSMIGRTPIPGASCQLISHTLEYK